jgi:EAL domain-containing protein (putative c-di-GMP-specific phosphodiesterase class I)
MAIVREFGIDQIQGFRVGRPAPAASFQARPAVRKRQFSVVKSA